LTDDIAAGWVLRFLEKYPTAQRIAAAHLASLEKIPYLAGERGREVQNAAKQSVASLRGPVAEALVTDLVKQLRHCRNAERSMQKLLTEAFAELPGSAHTQIFTIPGIGPATAAVLVAKIVDIDRFDTPDKLVGYFGIFPEENRSGVDHFGNRLPLGTMQMSRKGCDLVRG
jgi:transposase